MLSLGFQNSNIKKTSFLSDITQIFSYEQGKNVPANTEMIFLKKKISQQRRKKIHVALVTDHSYL